MSDLEPEFYFVLVLGIALVCSLSQLVICESRHVSI